jgi:hypothetical protein
MLWRRTLCYGIGSYGVGRYVTASGRYGVGRYVTASGATECYGIERYVTA